MDEPTAVQEQVDSFIDKYDPELAELVRACRRLLWRRFPTALELVYDNYNALAIGYAASERVADVVVSLAVYPRVVRLFFNYGTNLPDPTFRLEGEGKQTRSVSLPTAETLLEPDVEALMAAAITQAAVPLPDTGEVRTIVKSISAKQRPRRPSR